MSFPTTCSFVNIWRFLFPQNSSLKLKSYFWYFLSKLNMGLYLLYHRSHWWVLGTGLTSTLNYAHFCCWEGCLILLHGLPLVCCILFFFFFFCFFLRFIHLRENERKRWVGGAEGEGKIQANSALSSEPVVRHHLMTLRSRSETKPRVVSSSDVVPALRHSLQNSPNVVSRAYLCYVLGRWIGSRSNFSPWLTHLTAQNEEPPPWSGLLAPPQLSPLVRDELPGVARLAHGMLLQRDKRYTHVLFSHKTVSKAIQLLPLSLS